MYLQIKKMRFTSAKVNASPEKKLIKTTNNWSEQKETYVTNSRFFPYTVDL